MRLGKYVVSQRFGKTEILDLKLTNLNFMQVISDVKYKTHRKKRKTFFMKSIFTNLYETVMIGLIRDAIKILHGSL